MNPTKMILVVGSSGGIGKTVAEKLLEEGYEVVGTYWNNEAELGQLKENGRFSAIKLDLKSVEYMADFLKKYRDKKIYGIVNCGGMVKFEGKDMWEDLKIWEETLAVNLSSNFYLAKLFEKNLEENGRFIMISSTDAMYGGDITASYAASKAGVNSLTKSLSLLWRDKKIHVNAVAPGWVSTPMIEGNTPVFYKKLAETNPLGRIASPTDVANLIQFLLSEKADYINGQTITIDGGYTNQDPTLLLEAETKL